MMVGPNTGSSTGDVTAAYSRTWLHSSAVNRPIARGKMGRGELSTLHPANALAHVQDTLVERNGLDPDVIEQVVGGCVTKAGEQSFNITRNAWLAAASATGASFTELTVMETVAGVLSSMPSLVLKVKLSGPR